MAKFHIFLKKLENPGACQRSAFRAANRSALMEFHIRREVREAYGLEGSLFSLTGNVVLADMEFHQGASVCGPKSAALAGTWVFEFLKKYMEFCHFFIILQVEKNGQLCFRGFNTHRKGLTVPPLIFTVL